MGNNFLKILFLVFLLFTFKKSYGDDCTLKWLEKTATGTELLQFISIGHDPKKLWDEINHFPVSIYTGPIRMSFMKISKNRMLQCLENQRVDFTPPNFSTKPYGEKSYICFKVFTQRDSIVIYDMMTKINGLQAHVSKNITEIKCSELLRCKRDSVLSSVSCQAQMGEWIEGKINSH